MKENQYFTVQFNLFNYLSSEAALLYSYLVNVEATVFDRREDYFKLSNSFIQKIFKDWSKYKIRTLLNELVDKEFIKLSSFNEDGNNYRYIKII